MLAPSHHKVSNTFIHVFLQLSPSDWSLSFLIFQSLSNTLPTVLILYKMQCITVALLALAVGIEASPAAPRPDIVAPPAAGSGIFPTATGVFPTGVSGGFAAPTGLTVRANNSTSTSSKAAAVVAGGSLPKSSGTSVLSAVKTIAAGESFDGGMVMFDRGTSCTGQSEGDDSDAVFEIEDGGSLSNVIIGPNQIEGVHCFGSCSLENVWWSAVCEDAFTIKEQDSSATTYIVGGGAFGAVGIPSLRISFEILTTCIGGQSAPAQRCRYHVSQRLHRRILRQALPLLW